MILALSCRESYFVMLRQTRVIFSRNSPGGFNKISEMLIILIISKGI